MKFQIKAKCVAVFGMTDGIEATFEAETGECFSLTFPPTATEIGAGREVTLTLEAAPTEEVGAVDIHAGEEELSPDAKVAQGLAQPAPDSGKAG